MNFFNLTPQDPFQYDEKPLGPDMDVISFISTSKTRLLLTKQKRREHFINLCTKFDFLKKEKNAIILTIINLQITVKST